MTPRYSKRRNIVDPTWAPGVTDGWLEDGVHENDVEKPDITTEHASSETKVCELADHLQNTTYTF
jgi:hypothetical protein